jgi:hypothetical protein
MLSQTRLNEEGIPIQQVQAVLGYKRKDFPQNFISAIENLSRSYPTPAGD